MRFCTHCVGLNPVGEECQGIDVTFLDVRNLIVSSAALPQRLIGVFITVLHVKFGDF